MEYLLLMLSRCCFHHLVENLILYKKMYSTSTSDHYFFSENKIIQLAIGGKVDGQK